MPIHFRDLNVLPEVEEARSVLIVPCNMCPAVTVATREGKPFIELFNNFLTSAPFEQYIRDLQSTLRKQGVRSELFKSSMPHQWFMCMWTTGQRRKLARAALRHDAVIVLGCGSATETVRQAIGTNRCKVVEGMQVAGIINAKLRFRWPCNLSFEDCRTTPVRNVA
jgi:hypothetical protein